MFANYDNPVIFPAVFTSMCALAGDFGKASMVIISPQMATIDSASRDNLISATANQ